MASSSSRSPKRKARAASRRQDLLTAAASSPSAHYSDTSDSEPQRPRKRQRSARDNNDLGHENLSELDGVHTDDEGQGVEEEDQDRRQPTAGTQRGNNSHEASGYEDEGTQMEDGRDDAAPTHNAVPTVGPPDIRSQIAGAPDPATNPEAAREFAQLAQGMAPGRLLHAPYTPLHDLGGNTGIPDAALVLIHDRCFVGLTLEACKANYIAHGGGRGATTVSDNSISKRLKAWGPAWYDLVNVVYPWNLLSSNRSMQSSLAALGLTPNHFPLSTVQQPPAPSAAPALQSAPPALLSAAPTPSGFAQSTPTRPQGTPRSRGQDRARGVLMASNRNPAQLPAAANKGTGIGAKQTPPMQAPAARSNYAAAPTQVLGPTQQAVPRSSVPVASQQRSANVGPQRSGDSPGRQGSIRNEDESIGDDEPRHENTLASRLGAGVSIHAYLRAAQNSLDTPIWIKCPEEDGIHQTFISGDALENFTHINHRPVTNNPWVRLRTHHVKAGSQDAASVFAASFCSAQTGGPLVTVPRRDLKWKFLEGMNMVGRDEFMKVKPEVLSAPSIEWTADRLYSQFCFAREMKSMAGMDMVVDEFRGQYLQQTSSRKGQGPWEPPRILHFDIKKVLDELKSEYDRPFRVLLLDMLVAEGKLDMAINGNDLGGLQAQAIARDHGPQKSCLVRATQAEVCARYHLHAARIELTPSEKKFIAALDQKTLLEQQRAEKLMSGEPCYKEQAETYDPELNARRLYEEVIPQNFDRMRALSIIPGRWDFGPERRARLQRELREVMELLQKDRLEWFSECLSQSTHLGKLDALELLSHPESLEEAEVSPKFLRIFIAIASEYEEELEKAYKHNNLLEEPLWRTRSVLERLRNVPTGV